jgi:methyl-accepting chemotaxis protein
LTALASVAEELPVLDQKSAAPVFGDVIDDFPTFQRITMVDPKGVAYASYPESGATTAGLTYMDRDWFQAVVANKKPYISRDVTVGRLTGRSSLAVAVPILGRNGELRSIVTATIDIKNIQDAVAAMQRRATGHVIITTDSGALLATSDSSISGRATDFSKQAIWANIGGKDSGMIGSYQDEQGQTRVAGFATVPSSGWKIWASQTRAEIDNQVRSAYTGVLPWFVAAVALALLVAGVLTSRMFKPIEGLRSTATRIAEGDLNERAPETGPRELVMLARAVNGMAENLQQNILTEQTVKATLQRAVAEFGDLAARVAGGNLTVRASVSEDSELGRLGQSLNLMIESLARMVAEIRAAAGSVASASAEILAATSQQVSVIAEEATAVRQTATTITEVKQTAEMTTRKTRSVSELAQRMATTAEDGQHSVEESVVGSEEAKVRMEALAERILSFSMQAEAIAEINATVSEIAGQSNLLAVNAGIEAAKAGEAGRGFAVVAAEVKGLAERCKEATVQVRRIVSEIQKSAQATVIAAEQGVKAAEAGAGTARRSGDAIAALAQSVNEASQAAQQIMATAEQQESGMDQISIAMRDIEQSSAQTVATMRQVETAAKNLDELARNLTSIIKSTVTETA